MMPTNKKLADDNKRPSHFIVSPGCLRDFQSSSECSRMYIPNMQSVVGAPQNPILSTRI